MTQQYFETIKSIKHAMSGKSEEYLTNLHTIKQNNEYKNKKLKFMQIVTADFCGMPGSGRKCLVDIGPSNLSVSTSGVKEYNYRNFVIKNIRFNNQNIIRDVVLEIQGWHIDKLYPGVDGMLNTTRHILGIDDSSILPFGCCVNDNYLPLLGMGSIRLNILFKTFEEQPNMNYDITYELYDSSEDDGGIEQNKSTEIEFVAPRIQFTGPEQGCGNSMKFRFSYDGVMTHIFFSIPGKPVNKLKKVDFRFIGQSKVMILEPIVEEFGNFYIIPLTPSLQLEDMALFGINFNEPNNVQMNITLENNVTLQTITENGQTYVETGPEYCFNIFGLSQQGCQINNGKLSMLVK